MSENIGLTHQKLTAFMNDPDVQGVLAKMEDAAINDVVHAQSDDELKSAQVELRVLKQFKKRVLTYK